MSTFVTVSEDFTNRNQSWEFTGIYRNNSGEYRVHVRANAYEDQSYAKIEQWGVGGWLFYTSLPTEDWYADVVSYTKRTISNDERETFYDIRDTLLARFANARWGATERPEVIWS